MSENMNLLRSKIHQLAGAERRALDANNIDGWRALCSERKALEGILALVEQAAETSARTDQGPSLQLALTQRRSRR